MKIILKLIFLSAILPFLVNCTLLDTKLDLLLTQEDIDSNYKTLSGLGHSAYLQLENGFETLDNNIRAAMSDEAAQTYLNSSVQEFCRGSWNAYYNPDNVYEHHYNGIRKINYFLNYSNDFRNQLAHNRDTLTDSGYQYRLDVADIGWLRAESRVLLAYNYFELMKRYGGVPIITKVVFPTDGKVAPTPRSSIDEVVNFSINQIDYALDSLQIDWKSFDQQRDGRFTKGAAMALKARILLYAASPLYNEDNNIEKWKKAAQAAHEVIQLKQYSLSDNYESLFVGEKSVLDKEIIMSLRLGPTNYFERQNYPVGTPGGNSGVTPSHNLVSAYEYKGHPDSNNPYVNRDPRLNFSIVTNNSSWNGRTIEIWPGGKDDYRFPNTSRTGYYLKKFLNENLYLQEDERAVRSWVIFRFGEVLLNYAEAMNEAYGPTNNNGYSYTALEAINMIRNRKGVEMPNVTASNKEEMRKIIKHERRIELAFEGHRYWDLRRWKDAEVVLNQPLMGVRVQKDNLTFIYTEFVVENRRFDSPKMYFYPIPQSEVNKTENIVKQNPGW
ncbi:MAG: RagB/SusD family nutrient uptake outer membrane protein [Fermentimonas sp.]|jgi:hypothetical protein